MDDASALLRVYTKPLGQVADDGGLSVCNGPVAPCTSILAGGIACLAVAVACGVEISIWFQPTCVGILWAGLFLTGFAVGSVASGRLLGAALAVGCLVVANIALQRVTDIGANDCILVAASLLAAGWLAARSKSNRDTKTGVSEQKPWRMSIWDLGFVTLLVACFCQAIPNLSTTPTLLVGVLVTLLCCLLTSWVASRWALTDRWSFWSIVLLAFVVAASIGWALSTSPDNTTLVQLLTWATVGPLNVIASHGTVALLLLALARHESQIAAI